MLLVCIPVFVPPYYFIFVPYARRHNLYYIYIYLVYFIYDKFFTGARITRASIIHREYNPRLMFIQRFCPPVLPAYHQ